MKLWEMSFVGAVMVCGILLVRAAGYRKVSRQIFLVLWMAAVLRFLTPWQLPWGPEFLGYLWENQELGGERAAGRSVEAGGDSGGYSSLV